MICLREELFGETNRNAKYFIIVSLKNRKMGKRGTEKIDFSICVPFGFQGRMLNQGCR